MEQAGGRFTSLTGGHPLRTLIITHGAAQNSSCVCVAALPPANDSPGRAPSASAFESRACSSTCWATSIIGSGRGGHLGRLCACGYTEGTADGSRGEGSGGTWCGVTVSYVPFLLTLRRTGPIDPSYVLDLSTVPHVNVGRGPSVPVCSPLATRFSLQIPLTTQMPPLPLLSDVFV